MKKLLWVGYGRLERHSCGSIRCTVGRHSPTTRLPLLGPSCFPWCVLICPWPEILLFLLHKSYGVFWITMGCGNRNCRVIKKKCYQSPCVICELYHCLKCSLGCVLLWYPKSLGFLILGSIIAVVGVLPSCTPTPCSKETLVSTLTSILNSPGFIPNPWKDFWPLQWASLKGPI